MRCTLFSKLTSSLWGRSAGGASRTYGLSRSLSSELRPLLPPTHPKQAAAITTEPRTLEKRMAGLLSNLRACCHLPAALAAGVFFALAGGLLRVLLGGREALHLG